MALSNIDGTDFAERDNLTYLDKITLSIKLNGLLPFEDSVGKTQFLDRNFSDLLK